MAKRASVLRRRRSKGGGSSSNLGGGSASNVASAPPSSASDLKGDNPAYAGSQDAVFHVEEGKSGKYGFLGVKKLFS